MRKFRVWDKKYERYSEEPFYRLLLASNGDIYNSENDEWYKPEERYTIQFFTGMKDKKGKEIYEGDKLRITYYDSEWKTKVRDYRGISIVDVEGEPWNTTAIQFLDDDCEIEVIGNIYE